MKLTAKQITTIKHFIQNKGYTEPDLLLEMLDHVTCKVEDKVEAQPDMSFEQALNETYTDFGFRGFRILAESIIKGYRNDVLANAKNLLFKALSFPYIFLLLTSALAVYLNFTVYYDFSLTLVLLVLSAYFIYYYRFIRPQKIKYDKFLAVESISNYTIYLTILFNAQWPLIFWGSNTPFWAVYFTLYLLTLAILLIAHIKVLKSAIHKCDKLMIFLG